MAISLRRRLPGVFSDLPENWYGSDQSVAFLRTHCSLFGLAPGGVCRANQVTLAAGALLPHHFTLTDIALPTGALAKSAVSFLLHFPWPHDRSELPTTLSCGARTFLS